MTGEPPFANTLRGIWLLTWRSQLKWRRLHLALIALLVLPVLIFFAVPPEVVDYRPSPLEDPGGRFESSAQALRRRSLPLKAEQEEQLRQIFREEFQRGITDQRRLGTVLADLNLEATVVRAANARILERAQTVLDAQQLPVFQSFVNRNLQPRLGSPIEPRWSQSTTFYQWLINFYFLILLPLQCVRLSGSLIRDELQTDTLGFLTTRPMSRARLVIAKYLSQTAWLQIVLLLETLLIVAAGLLRGIPSVAGVLPILLATQFLAVFAWSALGLLLGMLTNRYIAVALIYGVIVELGIGHIPTNIHSLSIMLHLKTLLVHHPALQSICDGSGNGVVFSVIDVIVATGMSLFIAALMFTFREYHHTTEMQR